MHEIWRAETKADAGKALRLFAGTPGADIGWPDFLGQCAVFLHRPGCSRRVVVCAGLYRADHAPPADCDPTRPLSIAEPLCVSKLIPH